MLIRLDETIESAILAGQLTSEHRHCLDLITTGYAEGKHQLLYRCPNPSVLQSSFLSNKIKALLKRAHDQFSSTGSLLDHIPIYINVGLGHTFNYSKSIIGKHEVYSIPLTHFNDSSRIQSAKILGENLEDAKAFVLFAKLYNCKYRQKIRLSPSEGHGGGNTTAAVFQDAVNKGLICLCIVDSDKDHPDSSFGQTAKQVLSIIPTGPQVAKPLPCKSIENLIFRFHSLLPVLPHCTNTINKFNESPAKTWFDYLDCKTGIKCNDIETFRANSKTKYDYWTDVLTNHLRITLKSCTPPCSSRELCTTFYLNGTGPNFLPQFVKTFEEESHKLVNAATLPHIESILDIGKLVLSFCCASERSIAY